MFNLVLSHFNVLHLIVSSVAVSVLTINYSEDRRNLLGLLVSNQLVFQTVFSPIQDKHTGEADSLMSTFGCIFCVPSVQTRGDKTPLCKYWGLSDKTGGSKGEKNE